MGKRSFLAAALALLLTSVGCTRSWCEHHGYYPAAPAAACQPCCVPCCQPCAPAATGYAAPGWNAPAAAAPCTCPPPH